MSLVSGGSLSATDANLLRLTQQSRLAAERIAPYVHRTPVVRRPGTDIVLKCEQQQVTGSFKVRGVMSALTLLQATHVALGSSGNHGIAGAWAGRRLGVQATVVMTEAASSYKRGLIRRHGGSILTVPGGNDDRDRAVLAFASDTGAVPLSSHDHPLIMAGQSSVGLEILQQVPDVGTIFVPVGGGGLLAGVCVAVRSSRRRVRVVGVEPVTANDTSRSIAAGARISIPPPVSVCDGALAQSPGEMTFPVIARLVDDIVEVTDRQVVSAVQDLAHAGMRVEPTGALAYAGARANPSQGVVVAVLSGGNISSADYRRLVDGSRRDGRNSSPVMVGVPAP